MLLKILNRSKKIYFPFCNRPTKWQKKQMKKQTIKIMFYGIYLQLIILIYHSLLINCIDIQNKRIHSSNSLMCYIWEINHHDVIHDTREIASIWLRLLHVPLNSPLGGVRPSALLRFISPEDSSILTSNFSASSSTFSGVVSLLGVPS